MTDNTFIDNYQPFSGTKMDISELDLTPPNNIFTRQISTWENADTEMDITELDVTQQQNHGLSRQIRTKMDIYELDLTPPDNVFTREISTWENADTEMDITELDVTQPPNHGLSRQITTSWGNPKTLLDLSPLNDDSVDPFFGENINSGFIPKLDLQRTRRIGSIEPQISSNSIIQQSIILKEEITILGNGDTEMDMMDGECFDQNCKSMITRSYS